MDRPTLYIETSIVSYLAADLSRDPVTAHNQRLTHEWWNTQRQDYRLSTSSLTALEAARGDPRMVQRRLAFLAGIPECASPAGLMDLARLLRMGIPLPEQARADAQHIALAAMNRIEYLLTWDGKHIANPRMLAKVETVLASRGYLPPVFCTPAELMRRKDAG
jgi:hypothetical protein